MRFHEKLDFKTLELMFQDEFEYHKGTEMDFLYNFIPKFVLMSIALTMQQQIKIIGDESDNNTINDIWQIWENNNMQLLKYQIAKHYYLYGQFNLETVLEDPVNKTESTKIILHHPSAIELTKVNEKIVKVIINSEEFIDGKAMKIRKTITEKEIKIKVGDGAENSKDNIYGKIPFIHVENSFYRIKSLVKYQDRMNLYEEYLDSSFDMHADPMFYDDLGESFSQQTPTGVKKENKLTISKEKRKIRKFLHYPRGSAGIKMLESNGQMADRMQTQQDKVWGILTQLYPEIILMEILKGGGQITGPGMDKRMIELTSNINFGRGEIRNGLEELNEIIGWLISDVKTKTKIQYEPIVPESFDEVLSSISKAGGLLSHTWQLEKLQEKGYISNADEEKKRYEKENKASGVY